MSIGKAIAEKPAALAVVVIHDTNKTSGFASEAKNEDGT
jgi:hypothetical protein